MTTLCTSHPSRRAPLLATFVLMFATACALAPRAGAQEAAEAKHETTAPATTTPYTLFQNSTLTGSGATITANNLPVVTSTGSIIYDNVTIQFNVAADGTLTVASGYPLIVVAPQPLTNGFLAGNYVGPSTDSNFLITVSGPGVGTGGTTEWSLQASSGASGFTYPSSATWYCGPLNKSNPLYTRLQAAKITSTAYSYGIGSGWDSGSNWGTDSLLGFAQTSKGLTIVSFTHGGVDNNSAVDTIQYTYMPPAN